MKSLVSTPPLQSKRPKAGRGKRGCLITGIILVLLIPGFYWLENFTGRRALEKVIADYEAEGDSLDIAAFLPSPVPAEENFGATPLLDGIMGPAGIIPEANAPKARREVLKKMLPFDWLRLPSDAAAPGKSRGYRGFEELSDLDIDWKFLREILHRSHAFTPSPDEPSAVKAVYDSLETQRPLFDELYSAAGRPKAFFTSAPADRAVNWPFAEGGESSWPYPISHIPHLTSHPVG